MSDIKDIKGLSSSVNYSGVSVSVLAVKAAAAAAVECPSGGGGGGSEGLDRRRQFVSNTAWGSFPVHFYFGSRDTITKCHLKHALLCLDATKRDSGICTNGIINYKL